MTIATVLTVFLVILGVMLVFQAYWLFGTALFPRMVGRARDRYKTPIRTTLIGLAVIVPTFLIGFVWLGQSLVWLSQKDGDTFNISNGNAVTHRDIVAAVQDVVGRDTRVTMGPGKFLDRGAPLDISRAL